jgi:PKD repeat protein
MKNCLTILLLFLSFSGLFAQSDCTVKIIFAMNKTLPPSYTFKTDPQSDGAKYSWSFGDKSVSDSPSPTHTFAFGDTYPVVVKVIGADGKVCYGELKNRFEGGTAATTMLSGKGKVVDKTATSGCGLMIVLDNGTYLIPAEMIPNFTLKAGQYLELVYDILKDKPSTCPPGIMVRIQKIAEIVQTVCNVPISFVKNNATPVSYTFKTAEQPAGSKYYWYFGDQGTSSDASPTFTFSTNGTYTIALKVLDASGKVCSNTLKTAFEGKASPTLTAKGKVKKIALAGCDLVISLENGTTLIPAKVIPEFVIKEGQYVEITYEKLGIKTTNCTEGYEGKILTIKEIVTTPACKAYFTATNQIWSDPSMMKKIAFANQSSGDIKECLWNFGDNTTSTELKPIHEYASFGEYKVCLVITTTTGCKSDYCTTVKVTQPAPVCNFDLVIKPKPETSGTFLFSAISNSDIKTWNWKFGDGKTSDAKNPEHTYEKTGTYEVTCTITTAAGCTAIRTAKYTVLTSGLTTCKGAVSLLLFDPVNNQCNGKATIKLLDENAKELTNVSYLWSDGRTGSSIDNLCPDKTYTVQASIEGVCQKNTSFTMLSKPVWRAAVINGKNSFSVIEPKEGVEYEWSFDNGIKLKGAEVTYDFATDGVYNITLNAVSGSDSSEYSQQIVVMKSITGTEIINKSELEVYPNPVKEMLIINLGNPVEGNLAIEVMNLAGQRVLAQQLKTDGLNQATINVKHLKSGIYFLRLTNGKYLITDGKFIKAD